MRICTTTVRSFFGIPTSWSSMEEEWVQILEFPNYEVSNFGQVANIHGDYFIRPSVTQQGGLKVGLVKNNKQYTRSLKRLVAEAFVPGYDEIFDTPIHLDGDQFNCRADNLEWRPRWFSWQYHHQFRDIPSRFEMGPLVELAEDGSVVGAYSDFVEIAHTHGMLLEHLWEGVNLREPVFPSWRMFVFANKV